MNFYIAIAIRTDRKLAQRIFFFGMAAPPIFIIFYPEMGYIYAQYKNKVLHENKKIKAI